ncbi:MAG: putative FAD-linked oxidoreductase [Syntrophorhabdaceae bacterium]|nr:putative FAD-linked oxidoreductase [Syntrophorhabdaceae bacterium]HNZ58721.1 FAD-linked oxidase C-terminal domain-containing protein [Syntrophorhabdaceae bacterium]HOG39674.1 FAD-linked oxidase C-terminal domain-containing protein [Syntrophorhabdaceae bacterium]HQP50943.1 FAD-linked oxidase C-terminal domain-containing protein [Syntrophorhabdaceae bacterium]
MDAKIIGEITKIVGEENALTSLEDRRCYSYDARTDGAVPDMVVFPSSADEVSKILILANRYLFSVIPRGQGTGLTGGSVPIRGGVVLVFTRMNRILEIDTKNLIAVVEPGVITYVFQEEIAKYGLCYPPDPASYKYSSIGGNVAECAGGPNSLKYGVTRDYVIGLEVVIPTGEILNVGVRTMKGVVGYDLTRLFVGSEGTLGVITKINLKLIPLPESKATTLALFKKVEDTAEAVSAIIASKIIPSTIEFMDKASIRCSEQANPMGIPEDIEGLLLIEVDGDSISIESQAEKIKAVLVQHNASDIKLTKDPKEADKLWQARRVVSQATYNLNPVKIAEDVVVPRSNIPSLIRFLERLQKKYGIPILSFGHAGDGNFHVSIMIKETPEDRKKAEEAVREIFSETIKLGGTLSGEHGIGTSKAAYLGMELSPEVINTMKKIKNLFDPNNIVNPGKIFPV